MTTRIAALSLILALSGAPAFAQSYTAPAGIPAATAPGGLVGRAAAPNLIDAAGGSARFAAPRYDDGLDTGSVGRSRDGETRHRR